ATVGRARRAQSRAELHQRLVPVAGIELVRAGRYERARELPATLRERRRAVRLLEREEAREDALHVAVDQRLAGREGDREHRSGGVGTDAGKLQPFPARARQLAAVTSDDLLRGAAE